MSFPKTEVNDKSPRSFPLHGVCLEHVLNAAKECTDTSILERLFPWAFETSSGKKLLEKKKAEAEAHKHGPKKKVDGEQVTITLDLNTARLIRSIVGGIGTRSGGPRRATGNLYYELERLGIGAFDKISINDSLALPDTWEECGKVVWEDAGKRAK